MDIVSKFAVASEQGIDTLFRLSEARYRHIYGKMVPKDELHRFLEQQLNFRDAVNELNALGNQMVILEVDKNPVGVALIKQSHVFPEVLEGRRIRTCALFYILPEHDTEESRRSLWEKCLSICTNLDAVWLEVHQDDPLVPFFKSNGFVIHRESLMPFAQPSYILIRYRSNR